MCSCGRASASSFTPPSPRLPVPARACSHRIGFITNAIVEYIPGPHMQAKATEEWERLLYEQHAKLRLEDPVALYLIEMRKRPYYGGILFGVRVCTRGRAR